MSSRWTHTMCETCWNQLNPGRIPYRVTAESTVRCCYCGAQTPDDIVVRDDPKMLPCQGLHES